MKSSTSGLACATAIKHLAFFHADHYLKLSEFLIFMKRIKNYCKKGILMDLKNLVGELEGY